MNAAIPNKTTRAMLKLDVLRVMKEKAIANPYAFLTAHGFTHHTAYRLAKGKPASISLGHLEKLCRILLCEPHDLLAYTRDSSVLAANDHLAFLERKEAVNMHAIISTLTHRQMLELTAEIAERYRKAS